LKWWWPISGGHYTLEAYEVYQEQIGCLNFKEPLSGVSLKIEMSLEVVTNKLYEDV